MRKQMGRLMAGATVAAVVAGVASYSQQRAEAAFSRAGQRGGDGQRGLQLRDDGRVGRLRRVRPARGQRGDEPRSERDRSPWRASRGPPPTSGWATAATTRGPADDQRHRLPQLRPVHDRWPHHRLGRRRPVSATPRRARRRRATIYGRVPVARTSRPARTPTPSSRRRNSKNLTITRSRVHRVQGAATWHFRYEPVNPNL